MINEINNSHLNFKNMSFIYDKLFSTFNKSPSYYSALRLQIHKNDMQRIAEDNRNKFKVV